MAGTVVADAIKTGGGVVIPRPIQIQRLATGAVATGTTIIPLDDTIPQITEGTEFMTLAITPTSVSSLLNVKVKGIFSNSVAATHLMALFQDATANALAVVAEYCGGGNEYVTLDIDHWIAANTLLSTTFRMRAGLQTAGTITFNGFGGTRSFGGVFNSSMVITEYLTQG